MFFLTPKFLKHAKLLHKGVTRFIHYKRDLLPQQKLDEIAKLRSELEAAIKARDEKRLKALHEEINRSCDRALPEGKAGWLDEHVEVVFVSLVIALGIRTYIAQPFQIPTGSMQPTLSGITAERTEADATPGLMDKFLGFFQSKSYVNAVSDHEGDLVPLKYGNDGRGHLIELQSPVTEHHFLILRPYCKVHFTDGHSITINCPRRQLYDELQFPANVRASSEKLGSDTPDRRSNMNFREGERVHVRNGQLLARGIVRSGDHVIVNKFTYHFRRPTRGEVFVFTTKNISGIDVPKEQGSQHYIKRLAGVPDDRIEIRLPEGEALGRDHPEYWKGDQRIGCELWVNDAKATEPGFRRVIERKEVGYNGYTMIYGQPFDLTLKEEQGSRRYLALGDNSANSSDGRYWGTVPEQNVVGPGWFCYWPLTNHFGVIK